MEAWHSPPPACPASAAALSGLAAPQNGAGAPLSHANSGSSYSTEFLYCIKIVEESPLYI